MLQRPSIASDLKHARKPARAGAPLLGTVIAASMIMGGITAGGASELAARAAASDATPQTSSTAEPVRAGQAAPSGQFQIGDRLQISFFEHLQLPPGSTGAGDGVTPPTRTVYQRLDLSGEYQVDVDGTFTIPLLGRFAVAGKSLEGLRVDIATAFERETGRGGEVHAAIISRQPIFVTGAVRSPGSYAYGPGMIAIQAVALAGGYLRAAEGSSQRVDARRERERLAQASRRLQRLVVRRARLLQQHDGAAAEADRPGPADVPRAASRLLRAERAIGDIEKAVRQREADAQQALVESAQGELKALKTSLDLVQRQINTRGDRLNMLQQMQGRGVSSLEAVWSAQKDVIDYELQQQQLITSVHMAEMKVRQAELAKAGAETNHQAEIMREVASLDDEIAALEATVIAAGEVASALDHAAGPPGVGPGEEVEIQILRRTPQGVIALAAREESDLMPGDVVKIVPDTDRALRAAHTGTP